MSDELKFPESRQYGGRGQRSGAIQLIGSKDLAIEILKSRAERAEQMVERLIEAGKKLSIIALLNTREDIETWERWHALVAEWQANQKGDSNV
jgi:hypothetical protein